MASPFIALELGDEDCDWEGRKMQRVLKEAGRVRVFGNATLSICWPLQGSLAGYVDLFGMIDHGKWQDLVAPLAIAQEAGMQIKKIKIGQKTKLVCALPSVFDELVRILEE